MPQFLRTETIDIDHTNFPAPSDIINIEGATYSSDGKNLNVTLWINNLPKITESDNNKSAEISYSMLIDSDSSLYTGNMGIEYVIQYIFSFDPQKEYKTISYSIYETPLGNIREISYLEKYDIDIYNKSKIKVNNLMMNSSFSTDYYDLQNTIFKEIIKPIFELGSAINYNLPLDHISQSKEMTIYFKNTVYEYSMIDSDDTRIDSFGPIHIPPSEYYIKTDPNSIELRPNSKDLVNILISNISSSYLSYANLSVFNIPDNIKIKFIKANSSIPLVGSNDVLLNSIIIQSLDTSNDRNVVYLPMKIIIQFPNPKIDGDPSAHLVPRYLGELDDYTTKTLTHNFPIRLLPPQTLSEVVNEKFYLLTYEIEKLWDRTGEFLNFIYVPIVGILTFIIKKALDKRKSSVKLG